MNRTYALILAAVMLLCTGCQPAFSGDVFPSTASTVPTTEPINTPGPVAIDFESYAYQVGYRPDSQFADDALRPSHPSHYPIHQVESVAALEKLLTAYFPEYPKEDVLKDFSDAFFQDFYLLLVYVESGSGSIDYCLSGINYVADSLELHVSQGNSPEVVDCVASGWLLGAGIHRSYLELAHSYRAVYSPPKPDKDRYCVGFYDPLELLLEKPDERFAPGHAVTIHTKAPDGSNVAMYLNGVYHSIGKPDDGGRYLSFTFEMPPEDVIVEFRYSDAEE